MKKYIIIISADGDEIWRKESNIDHMPGDAIVLEDKEWIVASQLLDAKTSYYVFHELREIMLESAKDGKRFQFEACAYSVYQTPFHCEEVCVINTSGVYNDPIKITWRRNLN